jgi:1,4-alpha-glucan branching enzyme
MYSRSLMNVTLLLLLLLGCAPRSPAPQVLSDGVRFYYHAPDAKRVAIAGSFNHWDQYLNYLMGPDKKGIWTITLPLSTGRVEYRFVINNSEWVLDPAAPSIDDGFDGKNSFVIVPP